MNILLIICILIDLVRGYICATLRVGNFQCPINNSYISSPGDFKIASKYHKYLPFDENCEKSWKEPFMFLQAADTQFGMYDQFVEWNLWNYGSSKEIEWSTQLVADVNSLKPRPKFIVICGDLFHSWPKPDPETRKGQLVDFKRVFSGLEVPLVCVCGNHDIGNTPNNETIVTYKKDFGDDYFSFWASGVFFIVINSQFFKDATESKKLAVEHEDWLKVQLEVVRTEKPKHAVVFQHIPWFFISPDENDQYSNIDRILRKEKLEEFHGAGIRHIFTGHYHRNAGGFYKDLEVVVTSAAGLQLGDDEPGFRIVKVLEDKLEHKYYNLGASPREISFTAPLPNAFYNKSNKSNKSDKSGLIKPITSINEHIHPIYSRLFG